jgi:GT2 family glycosyltransferase
MNAQPPILAITLNWRQPQLTIACVRALQAMAYPRLDIMVIDNGSGDGSATILAEALPEVETVTLAENLGFAGGCNWGLRAATARGYTWALLINNDAFAARDMLQHLIAAADDQTALLSPKIFYEEAPERIWFAGGRRQRWLLELRDTGRLQTDGPAWAASRPADYLLGTCLLVNLQAVGQVGFLDEAFFMYYEDLDWSIRLTQAGYGLKLVAPAHLVHRISISAGGAGSAWQRYLLARSSVLFFGRHARLGQPLAILGFRVLSALKIVGSLLLKGEGRTAVSYLRGLRDGWRQLKETKK